VGAHDLADHPRGRTFAIRTEARVADELVWEQESTMLRRGGGSGGSAASEPLDAGEPIATWTLPGDLGRRYAAVSGDHNPIHLHPLSAKALGFPRAIAHGMWTVARALAALENRAAEAHVLDVRFRRPILLPGQVTFSCTPELHFTVDRPDGAERHLDGTLTSPNRRSTS
jgi:hypothetical protein